MICFDRLKKAFSNFLDKISGEENKKEPETRQTDQLESKKEETIQQQQNIQQPQEENKIEQKQEKISVQTAQANKQESKRSFFDFLKYKTIKEDDLNNVIEELRFQLLDSDVSYEVTEKILEDLKNNLIGKKVSRREEVEEIVINTLKKSITEILTKNQKTDLIEKIRSSGKKPFVIIFFGVNGVGKTTTIAKVVNMLKKNNLSTIIAASDTFRAAAQEQLAYHASKLEVQLIRGKYGGDPASVAFDAISFAKSRNIDVVLIDTAGRMHIDSDLVEELKRVLRIAKPDFRILILDSLAGSDALEQARHFENNVGYDAVILTKVDADAKGGIALSLAYELKKPVVYMGVGQNYDDLIPFSPDWFVERIFSS
ncbi:cell division protein FtsY [Sulfolobus acidocaldarius SUSAZ]|nr:cell division protein FtsY [Sulfolobus acidocaldarius SUSAZ]